MRHEPVQLTLDVPDSGFLLAWAAAPHKRLPADVVFRDAAGGSALETLSLKAAYCVGYREAFAAGDTDGGAYVCHLVLSDPSGWTLQAGGPGGPFQAPAPRSPSLASGAVLVAPEAVEVLVEESVGARLGAALLRLLEVGTSFPAMLALLLLLPQTAHAPGLPQRLPLPGKDALRLAELERRHHAGEALSKAEQAEYLALLAQLRGLHVDDLDGLKLLAAPVQRIPNKFPGEAMPADGKIIPYQIVDGNIKGVNGRRQFDFVIDDKGKLVLGNKHHLLGNSQSVQAAGQLRLNGQGKIRQIDNLSGHYQPSVAQTANYPRLLENAGVKVKGATIVSHSISTNTSGMVTGVKVVSSKVIK